MDPLVVASPHFDDAVLSCGQLMAGRPDCVIATVFALCPPELGLSTDFDRHSGFARADDAVLRRMAEDDAAALMLSAAAQRLPFIDDQYRSGPADVDAIVEALLAVVRQVGGEQLVAPLGLAHPDHVAVSEAALTIALRTSIEVVLYEELPARVLWPEQVWARFAAIRGGRGLDLTPAFIGTGPVEVKARAVACYRSQAWALDRRCLFVPERYWSVTM